MEVETKADGDDRPTVGRTRVVEGGEIRRYRRGQGAWSLGWSWWAVRGNLRKKKRVQRSLEEFKEITSQWEQKPAHGPGSTNSMKYKRPMELQQRRSLL